jgi:hypothetical protein
MVTQLRHRCAWQPHQGAGHDPKQLHKKLIDVEKEGAKVLHMFPVPVSARHGGGGVQAEALEVAGGDPHSVLAETKAGDKIIPRARRSPTSAITSTKISNTPFQKRR